jgi:diadenosine tetraphosphatase ApaH/serine/threonine PP2A family protein phosphatase
VSYAVAGHVFEIAPGTRYLINPGSVGLSRDRDPRASFLVLDSDAGRVQFHRTAYDAVACHAKAGRAGLLDRAPALRRVLHQAVRPIISLFPSHG